MNDMSMMFFFSSILSEVERDIEKKIICREIKDGNLPVGVGMENLGGGSSCLGIGL